MGCAEGRSPFAGGLRVPLRYSFFPLPGQEGGQGGTHLCKHANIYR